MPSVKMSPAMRSLRLATRTTTLQAKCSSAIAMQWDSSMQRITITKSTLRASTPDTALMSPKSTSELRMYSQDNYKKIVILPAFVSTKYEMKLMKIDNLDTDLTLGPRNVLEPDPNQCNIVPIECIDIAIIPGIAFDEKGGRIGSGHGYYDRLIPKLPITTRKVALTFEDQIVPQIQMEAHDRHVDIIITEKRIIYKI